MSKILDIKYKKVRVVYIYTYVHVKFYILINLNKVNDIKM